MSPTWTSPDDPDIPSPSGLGILRLILRAVPLALLVGGGFVLLLSLRLIEWPLFGPHRPWTPHITVVVCRAALWLSGLRYERLGQPMQQNGALVANHASWLDIFALNAGQPIYFVSKSEVSGWPGIGLLARGVGTVFISRDRKAAVEQAALLRARLQTRHRLLFFPEGTSTDGKRVLAFRSTLFDAVMRANSAETPVHVQPVTLVYHAPPGEDPRFYGWWGDMVFGAHLLRTLAAKQRGRVQVIYHPPLAVSDFADRKTLAAKAEEIVRTSLLSHLQ